MTQGFSQRFGFSPSLYRVSDASQPSPPSRQFFSSPSSLRHRWGVEILFPHFSTVYFATQNNTGFPPNYFLVVICGSKMPFFHPNKSIPLYMVFFESYFSYELIDILRNSLHTVCAPDPSDSIPVGILQRCIKLTSEPHTGLPFTVAVSHPGHFSKPKVPRR